MNILDPSTKIPISIRVLRSALHISHTKQLKDLRTVTKEYAIMYINIESVMTNPTGFLIDKKVFPFLFIMLIGRI